MSIIMGYFMPKHAFGHASSRLSHGIATAIGSRRFASEGDRGGGMSQPIDQSLIGGWRAGAAGKDQPKRITGGRKRAPSRPVVNNARSLETAWTFSRTPCPSI